MLPKTKTEFPTVAADKPLQGEGREAMSDLTVRRSQWKREILQEKIQTLLLPGVSAT